MTGLDVLTRELTLPWEWRLGAGAGARYAPAEPLALDRPGFRDRGTFLERPVDPIFAVSLLDRAARPIDLRANERSWNPARLELKYRLPEALMTERRAVLSSDVFVSQCVLSHADCVSRYFWLILWTRRPRRKGGPTISDIEANPQAISFQETNGADRLGWAIGASFDADSWSVNGSRGQAAPVHWRYSPFYDLMTPGGLPGHFPSNDSDEGDLYFALAYPFEAAPGERLTVNFAAALAPEVEQARLSLEQCIGMVDPIQASEEEWIHWLEEAPCLTCSDAYIQRAYWHRWATRRIWTAADPLPSMVSSAVDGDCAMGGHEALGAAIETAWRHSPELSTTLLRDLIAKPAGETADLPLARAVRQQLSLHPDLELRKELAELLAGRLPCELRRWEDSTRGLAPEPWNETPQNVSSLARTVYGSDLAALLGWLSKLEHAAAGDWDKIAVRLHDLIQSEFWVEAERFFLSPIPQGAGGRTRRAKTWAGFLPLALGELAGGRRQGLFEHLCDPGGFWTAQPIPSLGRDDPDFSADGLWKNQRLDSPENGRTRPAYVSAVIDALGRSIESAASIERCVFGELVFRAARMVFEEGDLNRPTAATHYHPLTGRPAVGEATQRPDGGWLIDHLLRYVAGIRPDESGRLLVDPLPLPIEWFAVSRVLLGDHEIEVEWDQRAGLSLKIDDEPAGHAPVGKSLSVVLPDFWGRA